ncbi:hypothetical protein [Streptomyces sp. NPDC101455]|uniref:hypothetical protein n=1 Tax=Streptomyces sp. NPDC101455 TaxID=3366142 RepID=UPI0038072BFD
MPGEYRNSSANNRVRVVVCRSAYGPYMSHTAAAAGVDRLYLVTPVLRISYADQVAAFLDLAVAAGVRHVTCLSTYGGQLAPPDVDIRAVEDDLAARDTLTHTILRPAWVMQNFGDAHLPVVDGVITVPTGGHHHHPHPHPPRTRASSRRSIRSSGSSRRGSRGSSTARTPSTSWPRTWSSSTSCPCPATRAGSRDARRWPTCTAATATS